MRVFTGNTMHGVFSAVLPQFERETGNAVEVIYDPAQTVLKRLPHVLVSIPSGRPRRRRYSGPSV